MFLAERRQTATPRKVFWGTFEVERRELMGRWAHQRRCVLLLELLLSLVLGRNISRLHDESTHKLCELDLASCIGQIYRSMQLHCPTADHTHYFEAVGLAAPLHRG
jgi:hypothetical protein